MKLSHCCPQPVVEFALYAQNTMILGTDYANFTDKDKETRKICVICA